MAKADTIEMSVTIDGNTQKAVVDRSAVRNHPTALHEVLVSLATESARDFALAHNDN